METISSICNTILTGAALAVGMYLGVRIVWFLHDAWDAARDKLAGR